MLLSPVFHLPHVFIPCATVLGLFLGSFYNVCIYRYLTGESIAYPPSHCPHCKKNLRFWELIPVLSYLALRGRCARCHAPISFRYPLVELISALIAGLLAWRYGPSPAFWIFFISAGMLIVASGIDFALCILPDTITLGGFVLALPASLYIPGLGWQASLTGALLGGGLFWLVLTLFKRLRGIDGMGLGDAKLMLFLGALCGPLALPLILLVAGISILPFFFLMAQRPNAEAIQQLQLPFGPFLSLGALVHLLAGPEILHWWVAFVNG